MNEQKEQLIPGREKYWTELTDSEKIERMRMVVKELSDTTARLYAQVQELTDEEGETLTLQTYRKLVSKYGRERLQRHIVVILAQKESLPGSFQRSEVAAFINRLQHDHPEPDWYRDLKRAERLSPFDGSQPNQHSLDLYGTFFRD